MTLISQKSIRADRGVLQPQKYYYTHTITNIVARILLSWFPSIQGNALVRPIITICDPYLNLFRNVVPPLFGLDLSPVIALFLLQALGSVRQHFLSCFSFPGLYFCHEHLPLTEQ